MDFRHVQFKVVGVIGDQIPRIGMELVLHVPKEIGRSIETNAPISPQGNPQEMIKTDEMVHVGMGNKNVADLQKLAWRKEVDIAEVEKKGLPPVLEVHIHTGVAEGIIDQGGAMNHFSPSAYTKTAM